MPLTHPCTDLFVLTASTMQMCIFVFFSFSLLSHLFLSSHLYLSSHMSLSLFMSVSLSLSLHMSLSLFIHLALSLSLSLHMSVSLSLSLFIWLSLSLFTCLSLSLYTSVSLHISPCGCVCGCVYVLSCLALKNAPVCTFKTLPCVRSRRPCHMGHGRLEGTYGSVLNVHTEAF